MASSGHVEEGYYSYLALFKFGTTDERTAIFLTGKPAGPRHLEDVGLQG